MENDTKRRRRIETPRHKALAYRIWGVCEPAGWNMTYAEVAERLGVNPNAVIGIAKMRGWLNRFRTTRLDTAGIALRHSGGTITAVDAMFDGVDDDAILHEVA